MIKKPHPLLTARGNIPKGLASIASITYKELL
jgi:hypothetical protein